MRDLHLTHGGFYRHFVSKEHLVAEAFALGLEDVRTRIGAAVDRTPAGHEVQALIDSYLDEEHCANSADGCPLAALGAEVARRSPAERARYQRALAEHIREMAEVLPGRNRAERERQATLLFSGMAGTLTLARVMTNARHRRKLLDAAKAFYRKAGNAT